MKAFSGIRLNQAARHAGSPCPPGHGKWTRKALTALAAALAAVLLVPAAAHAEPDPAPSLTTATGDLVRSAESTADCKNDASSCTVRLAPPTDDLDKSKVGKSKVNPRAAHMTLPSDYPFYTLQLNICNSGVAPCYSMNNGRSVGEAKNVILANFPDVVTLNEICENDLDVLFPTMATNYPYSYTFAAFVPAGSGSANPPTAPVRCTNGARYGIAVMGHVFEEDWIGWTSYYGWYASQDTTNEKRAFICAAPYNNYYACTTHTSSKSGSVALAQCNDLLKSVIPAIRADVGISAPVVVAGDFNLKYAPITGPNVQNCVPSGYYRKGDGDVQHFFATNDMTFLFTRIVALQYTDHDGLLVGAQTP